MKNNRDLRREAWQILRGKWFWRLVTVGIVLNVIGQSVSGLVLRSFRELNIQTWNDFFEAKVRAMQSGLDYTVPSLAAAWQMTGATAFQFFIGYIFAAILAFGFAGAALKATVNDENRWFADSFGGFRRPLELLWLMVLMNVKTFLWSLLFLVPGLVAAYRYRQAWYLKNEHADWSASQCIRESGRMMVGHKGRAFLFDCSYFGWFFLLLAAVVFSAVLMSGADEQSGALAGAVSGVIGLVAILLTLFVLCYYFVGRAVFYRDLKRDGP